MMATKTATETTISTRSRNLGYGWSTTPVQTPHGLEIEAVTAPDVIGGLRTIEEERRQLGKIVSGGAYYNERLFVGRRLITAVWGSYFAGPDTSDEEWNNLANWTDGWCTYQTGEVLLRLREGEELRVRVQPGA